MLNAEKYKKEISECIDEYKSARFSISEDCAPSFKYCDATYCNDCMLSEQEGYCGIKRIKWLLSEYKEPIKLSRLEHELLKFIDNEGYKYIARDNCGETLFRYPEKPTKNIYDEWGKGGICSDLRMFNDLFQFVKWEDLEPTSIQEVLSNCEVIEDD